VLEAFAAGLPVAGSDLGGIQELLAGVPGCALLPLEVGAWARQLQRLLESPAKLSDFVPPPSRGFDDLAEQLLLAYINE